MDNNILSTNYIGALFFAINSGKEEVEAVTAAAPKVPEECEITDQDLLAALKQMEVYIDVTVNDLKLIYALALSNAKRRRRLEEVGGGRDG